MIRLKTQVQVSFSISFSIKSGNWKPLQNDFKSIFSTVFIVHFIVYGLFNFLKVT